MQKVSKAYKESMKSTLRERGYIMVTFGLVNQEAQANATVDDGDFAYFSHEDNILGEKDEGDIYATLEENFTKVDGSMLFLPREDESALYYDTGIISRELVSDVIFEMTLHLNIIETDIKGLTINFGENYPVDFDIVSDNGQVVEFRGNTESKWSTEEVFTSCTAITLIFYSMKNPQSRLRIYSILFGYGLVYYNDSITDSSLRSYVSPIGADVPQIDFSVTLINYDRYFNIDNPNSAINYLETGQEVNVMYGYQLPDSEEIEWVRGSHLLCSEWESDDASATIKCEDVFRSMETEYNRGIYGKKSYYDLAVMLFEDAEVEEWYIDPLLKNLYTNNPMPRVQHKEGLQIIANACRCVLIQARDGLIQIKSNYMPDASVSTNGETYYSNSNEILKEDEKSEYGTLSTNYTEVNNTMFFVPKSVSEVTLETGYVSEQISDEDGFFEENPIVTVTMEAVRAYYGLELRFGETLPAAFYVRAINEQEIVNEYYITGETIDKTTIILETFDDCNQIQLEFVQTAEPYNRIVLNYFSLVDVTDFEMTRRDMTSYPKAIKQELIKEVIVVCYTYQENNKEEVDVVCQDVDVVAEQEETYYLQEPSYNFRVLLNDKEGLADIVEWGNYFITIRYKVTGEYRLDVQGYNYKIVEQYATRTLHARGKTVKWENPLISDMDMAENLADWLADYYQSGIEYEYDTRGNPELDANDIIYQENEFCDDMKVTIYDHTINFRQAFSGSVVARRNGV